VNPPRKPVGLVKPQIIRAAAMGFCADQRGAHEKSALLGQLLLKAGVKSGAIGISVQVCPLGTADKTYTVGGKMDFRGRPFPRPVGENMTRTLALIALVLLLDSTTGRSQTPPSGTPGQPAQSAAPGTASADTSCGCDGCDDGCHSHGGLFQNRNQNRSVDWGNCNCNGSYKFPVPPLYTYQWPGRYSQQLMTDYQSPWRFPPLRPYVDEPPYKTQGTAEKATPTTAQEASPAVEIAARPGEELPSEKFKRYYGLK
jgi:hypothetical protein